MRFGAVRPDFDEHTFPTSETRALQQSTDAVSGRLQNCQLDN